MRARVRTGIATVGSDMVSDDDVPAMFSTTSGRLKRGLLLLGTTPTDVGGENKAFMCERPALAGAAGAEV